MGELWWRMDLVVRWGFGWNVGLGSCEVALIWAAWRLLGGSGRWAALCRRRVAPGARSASRGIVRIASARSSGWVSLAEPLAPARGQRRRSRLGRRWSISTLVGRRRRCRGLPRCRPGLASGRPSAPRRDAARSTSRAPWLRRPPHRPPRYRFRRRGPAGTFPDRHGRPPATVIMNGRRARAVRALPASPADRGDRVQLSAEGSDSLAHPDQTASPRLRRSSAVPSSSMSRSLALHLRHAPGPASCSHGPCS